MDGGEARRAERKERRDRERRRKGAEQSDEAFGGDDLAVRMSINTPRRRAKRDIRTSTSSECDYFHRTPVRP